LIKSRTGELKWEFETGGWVDALESTTRVKVVAGQEKATFSGQS